MKQIKYNGLNLVILEKGEKVPMCEKCWSDAYLKMLSTGRGQSPCYHELLEERKNNPCQILLSELTEEQAAKLIPEDAIYIDALEGGGGAKGFLKLLITEALKSEGLELREEKRSKYMSILKQRRWNEEYDKAITAYDKTIPEDRILIIEIQKAW